MKASKIAIDEQNSILMKGPWGYGKTISAASFALEGPIYIAYFDKKSPIELIHFFQRHKPELLDRIEYDIYGAHNANEYLNKLMALSRDCRYFAFITDSVTSLTSAAVNWSLGFRSSKNKDKDKIIPDFDEYKVETSIVTQALDICRTLPCHVIWTAHPVPSIKIEGSGNAMKISKTNPIVTYGSKVAGIIPGNFSEIYHFLKESDWSHSSGKMSTKYKVTFEQTGDDYAKSNLGLRGEIDITDRLFYEVWKEKIKTLKEELNDLAKRNLDSKPDFLKNLSFQTNQETPKETPTETPTETELSNQPKWRV